MKKPTVYLDTNIFSAYWYSGEDVTALARRTHTRGWWRLERRHFSLFVSTTTLNELRAGTYKRQTDCIRMGRAIPSLQLNSHARQLLEKLVKSRLIPDSKTGDLLQMAVSAAHQVDYLLTWNYAHLLTVRITSSCEAS